MTHIDSEVAEAPAGVLVKERQAAAIPAPHHLRVYTERINAQRLGQARWLWWLDTHERVSASPTSGGTAAATALGAHVTAKRWSNGVRQGRKRKWRRHERGSVG